MKIQQTECPETSAYKIQTPGIHPKESIQHLVHGESLKSSLKHVWLNINISIFTPKFTDVSKRHVNKDLYSIQELYRNIYTLL